jgi:predicted TIM-barrel fold metal-dependent hydrolase
VLGGGGAHFVPNDYVLKLAREHAEFLPGVSVHPARSDAREELERCLSAGAVLMKCLPNCQNIDCADRRFTRFWERMAEAKLPLLAHTGGEHTLPVVRPEFADPRTLMRPLEIGVPVIAAHCAGRSGLTDPEYFPALVQLMRKFPDCYADISALNIPLRSRLLRRCLEPDVAQRLVHGSDYPVLISGVYAWMLGLIKWRTLRQCAHVPNPLERDYLLKRATGMDAAVFTRGWDLLRRPIRARYKKTGPIGQEVAERPGEFSN